MTNVTLIPLEDEPQGQLVTLVPVEDDPAAGPSDLPDRSAWNPGPQVTDDQRRLEVLGGRVSGEKTSGPTFGDYAGMAWQGMKLIPSEAKTAATGAVQGAEGAVTPDSFDQDALEAMRAREEFVRAAREKLGPGFVAEMIQSIPDIGYSWAMMPATAAGAEIGAKVGSIVPGKGTAAGAALGGLVGGIAGGYPAMARADEYRNALTWLNMENERRKETGQEAMTVAEAKQYLAQYEKNMVASGRWEAGPESLSNVIDYALLKRIPGGSALKGAIKAAGGIALSEWPMETITQMGQSQAMVGTPTPPERAYSFSEPGDYAAAGRETLPGVLTMAGATATVGGVAKKAGALLAGRSAPNAEVADPDVGTNAPAASSAADIAPTSTDIAPTAQRAAKPFDQADENNWLDALDDLDNQGPPPGSAPAGVVATPQAPSGGQEAGTLSRAVQSIPVLDQDPDGIPGDKVAVPALSAPAVPEVGALSRAVNRQAVGMAAPTMAPVAQPVQYDNEQKEMPNGLPEVQQETGNAQEVSPVRGAAVTLTPVTDEEALTSVNGVPPTPLDAQAHEAASSPANDRLEPTPAQIDAGNYKKGHVKLHGLDISIENPAGSARKGTDEDGRSWQTRLVHHYGYIKGTVGRDKDHLDVFVKPGIDASTAGDQVFVVDQKNLRTGKFDEHKIMVGFPSEDEARSAYLANYDQTGPERIGAITAMPVDVFKVWLRDGDTARPAAGTTYRIPEPPPSAVASQEPPPNAASLGYVQAYDHLPASARPARTDQIGDQHRQLVKVRTNDSRYVWLDQQEIDNPKKALLHIYKADGKRGIEAQVIHRDNLDFTGQAPDVYASAMDIVLRQVKGKDVAFASKGAAEAQLTKMKIGGTHRVVQVGNQQFVLLKKGLVFDGEKVVPAPPTWPQLAATARSLQLKLSPKAKDGSYSVLDQNAVEIYRAPTLQAAAEYLNGKVVSDNGQEGQGQGREGLLTTSQETAPGTPLQGIPSTSEGRSSASAPSPAVSGPLNVGDTFEYNGETHTLDDVNNGKVESYFGDSRIIETWDSVADFEQQTGQTINFGEKTSTPAKSAVNKPETKPGTPVNAVFTEDAYQRARARLRSKLSQLNAGFDPELFNDGITIAGYHLERGARKFTQYAAAMIEEFGEGIRPYLKAFYNGVRDLPGIDWTKELDSYQVVQGYDVERFTTESLKKQAESDKALWFVKDEPSSGKKTTRELFAEKYPHKPWLLAGLDKSGEFERSTLLLTPEERKVEEEAIAQITADPEGAIDKYLYNNHPVTTMGEDGRPIHRHVERTMEQIMAVQPVIVNTDDARTLFQPYLDNPGKFSAAVHEPSSAVAKMVWAQALTIPDPRGINQVLFLGGGGGSGKGSALKDKDGKLQKIKNNSQIIYDGTLSDFGKADKLIAAVNAAGKERVYVAHVFSPTEKAVKQIVTRKWDKNEVRLVDGKIIPGRDVPPKAAAHAHYTAGKVFLKLAEHAKKYEIELLPIDNSANFDPQQISIEKMRSLVDNKVEGMTLEQYESRVSEIYEQHDNDPAINPTKGAPSDRSRDGRPGQGNNQKLQAPLSGSGGGNAQDGEGVGRGALREHSQPQAGEITEGETYDTDTAEDQAAGGVVAQDAGAIDVSGDDTGRNADDIPGRSVEPDGTVVSNSLRGSQDDDSLEESEPGGSAEPTVPGAGPALGTDASGVPGLRRQSRAKSRRARSASGGAKTPAATTRTVDEGLSGEGPGGDGILLADGAAADLAEPDSRRAGDGQLRELIKPGVTDLRLPLGGLERSGSWKVTASRNLDIIELIRTLDQDKRLATPEEQLLLAKYVGWGASEIRNKIFPGYATYGRIQQAWADAEWKPLVERMEALLSADDIKTAARSSQYAHYTSEAVTRSIWSALQRMGFAGGKVFEPGMGTGNFMGTMPDALYPVSRYTGIEFDNLTASIAKQLYPAQNIIHGDYTREKFPNNFFDVAIGNPPFAQTKILVDPDYKRFSFSLHDYFFAKTIDKVRPGGLLVFVTSRYTMDKQGDKARSYLAERADLVGAIRLPQTAFKQHSGTEVVTDVLFLRKRAEGEQAGGEPWLKLDEVAIGEEKLLINEYFVKHPEMVLGVHATTGTMYRKNDYTVTPLDGDIEAYFADAIEKLPANVYSVMQQPAKEIKAAVVERDFNPKHKKEGGIYLSDNGTLMRVEFGSGVPLDSMVKLSAKDVAWLKDYVPLRDLMKQARYDQFQDGAWEASLKKLNKTYDTFVKTHGPLNAFTIIERRSRDEDDNEIITESRRYKWEKLIGHDVEGPLVWSLEKVGEDGEISKVAFLKGRTIAKPVRQQPQSMPEALAVSLDEKGSLDLDHIGSLLGMSSREAFEALGNIVFETPQGAFELADQYLAGDVVTKLAEAERAAQLDEKFRRNVTALQAAQPKPLGPADISARLGMSWIPTEIIEEFAQDVLEINVNVSRHAATNTWKVDMGASATRSWSRRRSSKAPGAQSLRSSSAEWGTEDRGANEILDAVLNLRPIKILAKDKDGRSYTDAAATARVNELAEKMREAFKSWVWTDAERTGELLELYNRKYNNIAPRRFDGSHLTLPGLSTRRKLHAHQKRAIWRMIQDGNTYLAHAVGAGKTLEMIAAGMEMKRLGLIAKPMYVVPNDQLAQWSAAFLDAYPLANIMVADEENFHTSNRRRFMAQAAMNAPDAIIITQSSLTKLRLKQENVDPVRSAMLADLRIALDEAKDDDAPRHLISRMEQMIEAAEQRFDSLVDDGTGDNVLTFEDLGVDFLIVDEAHTYRKLDFSTVQQVKGIDSNGSKRALDLYLKTKYLAFKRPGRSHVFASGTPVTNTMGELYNVMRFFMEEQMERDDIAHFDAWSAMFGETAVDYELNAAGRYEPVIRFAKFNNLPELMKRVRAFMDVLTGSDLGAYVKRPEIKGGAPRQVITPPSAALQSYQKSVLQPRMQTSRDWKPSKQQPGNPDPIINIITDGRLSSIDMRFVDPKAKNDPNSKLNLVIDEIIRIHKQTKKTSYLTRDGKPSPIKGGAQVVFYNHGFGDAVARTRGFDGRAWINKRLKDAGIPLDEVAWFDEYKTGAAKLAVQKDVREGRKKIIIGNAKALGVGKNLQTRLYALHYIDPPWYPADVEQPHGRIIRQGNQNEEVEINWYATKGSYDSTMWQMVGRKGRFIEQAFAGDDSLRSMEDLSEVSQYEMARALSSGDERVIKLVGLQAEVERLQRLREAHFQQQSSMRQDKRTSEWAIETNQKNLADTKAAEKQIGGYIYASNLRGTIDGVEYTKTVELGDAIIAGFDKAMQGLLKTKLSKDKPLVSKQYGSINGIPLVAVYRNSFGVPEGVNRLDVTERVTVEIDSALMAYPEGTDSAGLVRRVMNRLNDLSSTRARLESAIEEEQRKLTTINKKLGAPFEHQQALNEKVAELAQLQVELTAEGEKAPEVPAAVTADDATDDTPKLMATAKFSQEAQSVALSDKEFDAVFRRITARLENTDGFTVVPTARALPARIVAEIEKQGGRAEDVDGVFHNGRVYIVREHVTSEAMLEEIVFHEWHGHAGLYAMFGNDKAKLRQAMLDLYGRFTPGELLRLTKKYNFRLTKYAKGLREAGYSDDERHATLMEELLVFMTNEYSRGPIAARIREIIGMVRDFLRRNGFAKLAEMGETDIAFLLKKARAYADTGTWAKDAGAVQVDGEQLLNRLREMGVTDEMLLQFMAGVPRFAAGERNSRMAGLESESRFHAAERGDDPSPAINIVLPDEDNVKFHLRDTAERISPLKALEQLNVWKMLNPLDWSRLRATAEKRMDAREKHAIGFLMQTHFWKQSEADPNAAVFYEEGARREEERHDYNVRMRGGLAPGSKGSAWQRFKDSFKSWTDEHTVWEEIKRQVYGRLTVDEQQALDMLVVEGDARRVEYGSLARALLNKNIKAAGVNARVFSAYQALMQAKDKAFDVALDIERELMLEAGIDPEKVERSIAEKRQMGKARVEFRYREDGDDLVVTLPREQATTNIVHQLRKIARAFGTTAVKSDGGDVVITFKASDTEAVREALSHVLANRIRGHMHRDHGDGERVVTVHQVVDRLDFEEREVTTKGGQAAVQMFLPYYPGRALAEQIEEVAAELRGTFLQIDGKGEILVAFRQADVEAARQKLAALTSGKKPRLVMVYARYVANQAQADALKADVEKDLQKAMPINYRDGATYEVNAGLSNSVQEEEYQAAVTGSYALDRITEQTLAKAVVKGDIAEQDAAALLDNYREELANTLLARGAGATMIRRAPYLIEGYDRSKVVDNFERQLNGTAGMLSKAAYALRQYKNLQKVQPQTRLWAVSYVENTLRNMGTADRLSGDVRAFASLWFLGGNLTWMLINHTQPYVFGVAELSRHIAKGALIHREQGALRRILTAEKDILARRLSAVERGLWHDPRVRVQIEETVMAEMAGSDSGVGGKVSRGVHTAARVTMIHGHKVEVLNRKIIILAAYRTFRAQGLEHGESLDRALKVNSAVNIDMGRHNLPGYAAKSAVGRTFYTLLSFTQHAWNWLYYRSTSGKREDQKAVLRLLFAMALLGGLPAGAPGGDELDKLILKWFGYSPKMALRTWTKKRAQDYDTVGELLDDFVWHGIPGTFGVSLTGSVQFRLPIVTSVIDGDTGFRVVGGAVGGLIDKGFRGYDAAQRGDYWRAAENLAPTMASNAMSAARQHYQGVTTVHGKPAFYDGRPVKMKGDEALLKAVGMQPLRTAKISETRGNEIELSRIWSERRQNALDRYRITGRTEPIEAFNRAVINSQAAALVKPITGKSLGMRWVPDKRQRRFQDEYGRE